MNEQLVKKIFQFNDPRVSQGKSVLWPVLVGPTGSGKTTKLRVLGNEMQHALQTLLLGTKLPEDVLGLPFVQKGVTRYSQPEWVQDDSIVFLDELDKARPESYSTILTLLAELRVHERILKNCYIVGAMQPVARDEFLDNETGKAISARVVWIRNPYDSEYLKNKYQRDFSFCFKERTLDLPVNYEPSSRQIEWLADAYFSNIFEENEYNLLLEGVMPGELHKLFMDELRKETASVYDEQNILQTILQNPAHPLNPWENTDTATLLELLPAITEETTVSMQRAALYELYGRGGPDAINLAKEKILAFFQAKQEAAGGGEIEAFKMIPDEAALIEDVNAHKAVPVFEYFAERYPSVFKKLCEDFKSHLA